MKATVDIKELENFLWFLQDKSADVYQEETQKAVKRFLEDIQKQ